eukprot:932962-Pyramimonas_sp.AAC.1
MNVQNAPDQTCKLVLLGFPRRVLANDLRSIGSACLSALAPAAQTANIIVRAVDMSKNITFYFETALESS